MCGPHFKNLVRTFCFCFRFFFGAWWLLVVSSIDIMACLMSYPQRKQESKDYIISEKSEEKTKGLIIKNLKVHIQKNGNDNWF